MDRVSSKRNRWSLLSLFRKVQFSSNVEQAKDLRSKGWTLEQIAERLNTTVEIVRIWLLEFED